MTTSEKYGPSYLLSRKQIEDMYGVSERWLKDAFARGFGPPAYKIGRLVRYRLSEFEEWHKAKKKGAKQMPRIKQIYLPAPAELLLEEWDDWQ